MKQAAAPGGHPMDTRPAADTFARALRAPRALVLTDEMPGQQLANLPVAQARSPRPIHDHGLNTALEHVARPLLTLMHKLSGLDTTFVTRIDWADQRQEVVVALNSSADLEVAEKSWLDWSDSMCRWAFLTGQEHSADVATDFPDSLGAIRLGMRTFCAVPILHSGDQVVGTVCAASRDVVPVAKETLEVMRLISQALGHLMSAEVTLRTERARADEALLESAAVRVHAAEVADAAHAMEALAFSDSLTGLANRRGFMMRFEEELARSGRHNYPVALLRLDVDGFKRINDTYGHDAGDHVLATLGQVLGEVARTEDVPARPGGDEFALVVSFCDVSGATALSTRIAAGFAAAQAPLREACSVSIGVACSVLTPRRHLLEAADRALYQAKRSGGDAVEVWQGALGDAAIA